MIARKRLILFVGVYDTLDVFAYEMKKEFDAMGYEVLVYDSSAADKSLLALSKFVQKPVTAALTFNNLGFNMELVEEKNIWDELGIPCINILMDHPFCYKNALDNAPANAVMLCVDRNHMKYIQRFYPNIPVVGFLPHAGIRMPQKPVPIAQRKTDVMYAGNLSKNFAPNIIPDLSYYESMFSVEKFCRSVYEDVTGNPSKTTEQGIEDELIRLGINLNDDELCSLISDFHFLDLYIVSHYREKVVAAVAKSGIRLDLYGAGWERCDWINLSNVRYHGKVPAHEVPERMRDTKIVLSTMTWFKDGTHDRIFNGMLQGAVAISDSSIYMKEEYQFTNLKKSDINDAQLVLFDLDETEQLPERIRRLLDNPYEAQKIADNGYERACGRDTWQVRARELDRELISELVPKREPKMRMLAVTHQLSRTGAPIVLVDMLKMCMEEGFKVDVISMQDGPLREDLEQIGIEPMIQERFWNDRENFRKRASDYDFVLANTLVTYEAVQALNNSDIPVLWWLHEGEQYFEYFKTVLPDFANMGANISAYAVGSYVQDVVERRYGVKIPVLHFAVEDSAGGKCEASKQSETTMNALNGEKAECADGMANAANHSDEKRKVRFLTAGTYSNVKAQDVLADAVRRLNKSDMENAEFLFCGNESLVDENVYNAVVKLEEDFSNVRILHQLTRAQTLELMTEVDCLIVPSRIEPLSAVAVEMMMEHGLVLCTDICGIAHYIEDGVNGLTVPPDNPEALSEKIAYVINHRGEFDSLRDGGRKIYEEHFSKEAVRRQLRYIID